MPVDPQTGSLPPTQPSAGSAIDRQQQELLDRIVAMRVARNSMPAPPDAGLSDRELARQLTYDMVASLTRSEIVIQNGTEAIIAHTLELRRTNDLKAAEVAQTALAAQRQQQLGSVEERAIAFVGILLGDSKVRSAIVSAIATVVGTTIPALIAAHFGVHP